MLFSKYRRPKIAMVLNGGGALGPFQIGVYFAMMKYNLENKIVATSSASVGAFSALLYLLKDPVKMVKLWSLIDNETIKSKKDIGKINLFKTTFLSKTGGLYSRDGLIKIIKENLNLESLLQNTRPTYISLAKVIKDEKGKVASYEPYYKLINGLNNEEILSYILATSAIPLVFDPVEINNDVFVDPMKADNEPYKPLMDYDFDMLFIVPLNASHLNKVYPRNFSKTIVDFTCPELFKQRTMSMLDFTKENQSKYLSLGYQTADLLFSLMESKKKLHALSKKEKNGLQEYYSLAKFNISDISFDIISLKEIINDVNKRRSKKGRINYE